MHSCKYVCWYVHMYSCLYIGKPFASILLAAAESEESEDKRKAIIIIAGDMQATN